MRRLFYATNNLDDAEAISDEVHKMGIDDHHFYILSRDENGIKSHHLHGSSNIDKTDIINAKKRANLMSAGFFVVIITLLAMSTEMFNTEIIWAVVALFCAYIIVNFLLLVTGSSFDGYFKSMFNERLDSGEVIIIIDVEKKNSRIIEDQLSKHSQAKFLADSSNLASPIPE
jgi:hypothetical protein